VVAATPRDLIPASRVNYYAIAFSPDGQHLYFTRTAGNGDPSGALYRMPVSGHAVKRIVDDAGSGYFALASDGTIAFTAVDRVHRQSLLKLVRSGGTAVETLAARPLEEPFSVPAWSPDTRTIAVTAGNSGTGRPDMAVVGVDVESGRERPLTAKRWGVATTVAWLPDGSGLIVSGRDHVRPTQMWHVSLADGVASPVTGDSTHFTVVGVAASTGAILAIQSGSVASIWMAAPDGRGPGSPLTSHAGYASGARWMADGRIVYASEANGNMDVWAMNDDGTGRHPLTVDSASDHISDVSPDGRHLLFGSDRAGAFHIWRMNADGSHPVQLTRGDDGHHTAVYTPDGAWVVYESARDKALWKVASNGGTPVQLSCPGCRGGADVSPTARVFAFLARHDGDQSRALTLASVEDGTPLRTFPLPSGAHVQIDARWAGDGRTIGYVTDDEAGSTLWRQSAAGGDPAPVLSINPDRILSFDWSPQGRLVYARGGWYGDLVAVRVTGTTRHALLPSDLNRRAAGTPP
jgi:TolB protein